MPNEENRPVHEINYWPIRASIWRNESEDGSRVWYTTQVTRRYVVKTTGKKAKTEYKSTHALDVEDLLTAAKALSEAHSFIHERMQEDREAAREQELVA